MVIWLYVIMPAGWAVAGKLLGVAVALTAPSAGGVRAGRVLGRWCLWLLPALSRLLFALGGSGDAGHGVRLFGSEDLFALLCLPVYAVPALGVYALGAYVVRDLLRGLLSGRS